MKIILISILTLLLKLCTSKEVDEKFLGGRGLLHDTMNPEWKKLHKGLRYHHKTDPSFWPAHVQKESRCKYKLHVISQVNIK